MGVVPAHGTEAEQRVPDRPQIIRIRLGGREAAMLRANGLNADDFRVFETGSRHRLTTALVDDNAMTFSSFLTWMRSR
jgi:hypothetical protein